MTNKCGYGGIHETSCQKLRVTKPLQINNIDDVAMEPQTKSRQSTRLTTEARAVTGFIALPAEERPDCAKT
ncbi:hypothetical protein BXY39_1350 [Eilatimonas milleporae]|uniref:Uncharacterized protein n=1 Tax=Eilatimonas milleporae TaxID=911205 RepID=A0A3M0CGH8_9PROT|nr:hypothetical protein BXY39_1350 [Eilatimonas milleporae]